MSVIIGLDIEHNNTENSNQSYLNMFLSYLRSIKQNKRYILYIISNNIKYLLNLYQIDDIDKGSYGICKFNQVAKFPEFPEYVPIGKAIINIKKDLDYFKCPWFKYSYDGLDHSTWKYDFHEKRTGFIEINLNNFRKSNSL